MFILKKLTLVLLQVAGAALVAYLIFALVFSSWPCLFPPKISDESKQALDAANFYGGDVPGPDTAALVEGTTDAFNARVVLLRQAQQSIDFVCHSVAGGSSTTAFFGELEQAANRGVKVRIVLDDKTGPADLQIEKLLHQLQLHPNIEYRVYNPADAARPWTWHSLLHDKFFIVDEEYLLLGGRNIGDRYYNPADYNGKVVDDRDVLIHHADKTSEESVLHEATGYMDTLWNHSHTRPITAEDQRKANPRYNYPDLERAARQFQQENPIFYTNSIEDYHQRMLPSRKITLIQNPLTPSSKEPWIGYQVRSLMAGAQESVLIQTPYATANKHLLDTLKENGQRCEITIVTNSMASSPNLPAYSNYYTQRRKFLDTNAAIYEYQSQDSIHGKSIIIDDQISLVGSFNLDDRSLYLDTETMLVIDSPEFTATLKEAIEEFQNQSLLVAPTNTYVYSEDQPPEPVAFLKRPLLYLVSIVSRLFQCLI